MAASFLIKAITPTVAPLAANLGYNGPYVSGFDAQGAQEITPTVSGRATKVRAWSAAWSGTRRVGFTSVKPGTNVPGSIPWLGFADLVGANQSVFIEGTLNTPVDFVAGTPIWAVSVNNGGSGDIACGTSAAGGNFIGCTINATAWTGATFASPLSVYYLMILAVP